MPYLRFKGFSKDFVTSISSVVIQEFAELTGVLHQKIKLELLLAEQIANSPQSLEILMFPRDQELHDRIVEGLYRILDEHGYPDVHIFFILLSPELYYKKGQPLKSKQTNPRFMI